MFDYYYYLHVNGDLIVKNGIVVDDMGPDQYFEGDFVVKWWGVDPSSRESLIEMLVGVKGLLKRVENPDRTRKRIAQIEQKSRICKKDYEALRRIKAGEPREKVLDELFVAPSPVHRNGEGDRSEPN